MSKIQFRKIHFKKIHFQKIHFWKIHFLKLHFWNIHFGKIHFRKIHFQKIHFQKIPFQKYTFRFSLFTFHFSLFTRATRDWKSESVTYLPTDRHKWVGARDTCVSKNIVTMHRLHDVLLFFKTSIKNRIVKNREEIDKKSHR